MNDDYIKEINTARILSELHFPAVGKKHPVGSALRRDWLKTRYWGWKDNIIGLGVSIKRTSGRKVKNQISVTLYVRRKSANARLSTKERVPPHLTLTSVGAEVVTDIVKLQARPVAQNLVQVRPVCPGAEIGHIRGSRGTLGLIVQRTGQPNVKLALSCSHVLARSGFGISVGDEIDQPLDPLANSSTNRIGALDTFSTILPRNAVNTEDFAVASLSVDASPSMLGTESAPRIVSPLMASQFAVGMGTQRFGIGSGPQTGKIRAFQSTWNVQRMPFVGDAIFTDVVTYDTVNRDGDSGAAVLDSSGMTVLGIHFAGSPTDRIGLFLPIGPMFQKHHLELVSG